MKTKTHIHWSIEKNDRCPFCNGETVLVVAHGEMKISEGDPDTTQNRIYEERFGTMEIDEEISGHVCIECNALVSIALNT